MNWFKRKVKKSSSIDIKFIKSKIKPDRLDTEYKKFNKHWVEHYKNIIKGKKEAEEMNRTNLEYDLIQSYCYTMYFKEHGIEYNDKEGNLLNFA